MTTITALVALLAAVWLAAEIAASRAARRPPEGMSTDLIDVERGLRR